jgi:uncharacterized RDD family membrane protein YckC
MFEHRVRPSKYRFLAPLLISLAAIAFFLPVYLVSVAFCSGFPSIPNCMGELPFYVSWFFLVMFFFGIVTSIYRAYRDFCKGDIRVMRLRS